MSARHNKAYTPGSWRRLDHYGGPRVPTVVTSISNVGGNTKETAIIASGLVLFKNYWDKLSHIIGDSSNSKMVTTSKTEPRSTNTYVAKTRVATRTKGFV